MGEVRQQCRFALSAFESLRLRLNEQDAERVFVDVHAFLGHAFMLARLLWPVRQSSIARGEALRSELKVGVESPLRMGGVHGQIEGWDEAYEDWLSTLPEAGYVDQNLMPTGTMAGSRADVFQRSLDPDTLVLQLRGAPVDLRRLSDSLRALENATQQWLRSHHPW